VSAEHPSKIQAQQQLSRVLSKRIFSIHSLELPLKERISSANFLGLSIEYIVLPTALPTTYRAGEDDTQRLTSAPLLIS
jgi:hypothetical protein